MKFSIILPVFNVEKYLDECIISILNQTFSDYEIILVDDGSTDSSPKICDKYANENENVIVLHKSNGGLSEARNFGLSYAKGDYIFFVDSDDYLNSKYVLAKLATKTIKDVDVILFKFQKYYENTQKLSGSCFEFPKWESNMTIAKKLQLLVDFDAYYNSAWSKIIKRKILLENNIIFEKGLLGEDNDWYYNVVLHAQSYEFINEIFYVYRQRVASITKTSTIKNLQDLIYIIRKWTDIINSRNIDEEIKFVLLGSLAKQFCHALIMYQNLTDNGKKEFKVELVGFSYLLKYSNNKRVITTRRMYKIGGFEGTILFFKIAASILRLRRRL